MPTVVQFRRGTTVQNDAFTGATGELSIDTDLDVVRVHDGASAGGHALVGRTATQTLTNKTLTSPTITTPTITTPAVTGNITVTGNVMPAANLTYNLGSTVTWWNVIYGKSVQAQYADLAENYKSDSAYVIGTVVVFGGEHEVTISNSQYDSAVAGIVSGAPAYLMNAASGNLPVALTGRVPCKVIGPVSKGEVLTTSHLPGTAMALDPTKFVPGCVIGKSLENIEEGKVELIEVAVGRF